MYLWPDSTRYEGEWVSLGTVHINAWFYFLKILLISLLQVRGERSGEGITTFPNGEKHDGSYQKNKMHGSGWMRLTSGKVRPGEWKGNKNRLRNSRIFYY